MTGPPWLAAVLAVVMVLIAVGSLVRLAMWRLRGQAAEPEADAAHVLMGVAMAGMFEPRISPVPGTAWVAVFTAAATWFAVRAVRTRRREQGADRRPDPGSWRCAHPAPHSLESVAMVYMLLAARGAGRGPTMAMPGMASAGAAANPAVALVLALFLLGYIVWTVDRMTSQSSASAAPAGPRPACVAEPGGHQAASAARAMSGGLGPRATACSRIAMSVAMGYMLLTML
jgi:Domain of unknown function (DUF5134)